MRDLVYIYDKANYTRQELGEIQTNFNLSFVIDGTKDSAKINVYNFSSVEVEPYSIIKHQATNTWWIVSNDKVERYVNENGYWYKHNLELLGAIELLNARDLTDSGFNQNRYTIQQFFNRLLNHSNFELKSNSTLDSRNNLDLDKNVDYVKTFENYTLLSAIREFFDAYNSSIKLDFVENDSGTLIGANFYVVSKTGNINSEIHEESIFNNIQETKTMDKDSFGTSVISNAENVISTKTKTYPSMGGIKLSANEYKVNTSNAVLRLPSDVYKVNYIAMYYPIEIMVSYPYGGGNIGQANLTLNVENKVSCDKLKQDFLDYVDLASDLTQEEKQEVKQDINNNFDSWLKDFKKIGTSTFYYSENIDPVNSTIYKKEGTPKLQIIKIVKDGLGNKPVIVSNDEIVSSLEHTSQGIRYYRGRNYIDNFTFLEKANNTFPTVMLENTDYANDTTSFYSKYSFQIYIESPYKEFQLKWYELSFSINYVPMSDIKIKLDNNGIRKDSQMYNQNGKLTDSVALSKSLLSYSKEIESDTITKYATFLYGYDNGTISYDMPTIGDLVTINNELYVINNISLDFIQHEDMINNNSLNYYVSAEFTLSKNIATKSLMVNPNTNIRDYGIPQNNNVKRKQLYRDFYELGHSQESNNTTWYLPLSSVLNVGINYQPYQEHIAVIKMEYVGAFGSDIQTRYFYQLESTTFIMKKSIYEIIDFKDNNIIGYGNQNVWSGFDISRVFSGMIDDINTPISYVDSNGEVYGISLYLCNLQQIEDIYSDYLSTTTYSGNATVNLYNYSCFIPSDVFGEYWDNTDKEWKDNNYGAKNSGKHDFMIIETNYEKDATEVPVFEYSCQIDDSEQVIIGSNILDNYETDVAYLYQFILVEKNKYNDNNYGLNKDLFLSVTIDQNNVATMTSNDSRNGYCELEYVGNTLTIKLYESVTFDLNTRTITSRGTQKSFNRDYDLMIIRNRILEEDLFHNVIGELFTTEVKKVANFGTPDSSALGKYRVGTDDNYYKCNINPPSNISPYELINTTTYSYDDYSGAFIGTQPSGSFQNGILLFNYYNLTSNPPYSTRGGVLRYIYNTSTSYRTSNMASWSVSGADLSGNKYIVALQDAGDNFLTEGVNDVPLTIQFIPQGDVDIEMWDYNTGTKVRDIGNETITLTSYSSHDYYFVCKNNESRRRTVTFRRSLPVNYQSTYPNIEEELSLNANQTRTVSSSTNSSIWKAIFFPADYKYYLYYQYTYGVWHKSGYGEDSLYGSNPVRAKLVGNNISWYEWNKNTQIWDSFNVSQYYTASKKIGRCTSTNPLQFTFSSTDESINYKLRGFDLYYAYRNNIQNWKDVTDYQWVLGASASNEYFTYNNTLYQYNSSINDFEIKSSANVEREDLMFIVKDMGHANISSDILSLYINYFKVN